MQEQVELEGEASHSFLAGAGSYSISDVGFLTLGDQL